jgi:hypothetical protein
VFPAAPGPDGAIDSPAIPEAIHRRRLEQAAAVEAVARGDLERRKRVAEAGKQVRQRLRIAQILEGQGKTDAAARLYDEIARGDPTGQFGRAAARRSAALVSGMASP